MLTATAVGMDEILLQWTIPQDNGTPITGFSIQQWDPDASTALDNGHDTNLLNNDDATVTLT